MSKIEKHKYYMNIAWTVATAGTCPRRQVGAVIVRNDQILATGYNGAPRKMPDCLEEGCDVENGHCVRSVHAELNAIIQAANHGVEINGATLFTTASCCRSCMKACINAGIKEIVYSDVYSSEEHEGDKAAWSFKAAEDVGINMVNIHEYGKPFEISTEIFDISGRGKVITPASTSLSLRPDQPEDVIIVNGKKYSIVGHGSMRVKTKPERIIELMIKEIS